LSDNSSLKGVNDERLQAIYDCEATDQETSTISRFNRLPAKTDLVLEDDFIQVLTDSQTVYQLSHRAFDPTVYPLVQIWGFGGQMSIERLQSPPTEDDIAKAKQWVGLDKVTINEQKLSKSIDGVGLDFSAL
ncbi:FAD:protein FMN transferase, partial [Moraxella catarrhalis]|uniref:FAD:protein FMN transferase n=1 Tax=Moraxella catarrhalis TaxID=480 RepID=UPI0018847088